MKGDIYAESTLGLGSTFRFTVHLKLAPSVSPVSAPEPINIQGKNCLIVDDNATTCEVLSIMLTALGFVIETASSGVEALENINLRYEEGQFYDLILIDWQMPEMNGIETGIRIKADKRFAKLPAILIMSAFFDSENRGQKISEAGLDGFITKPIMKTTLLKTIASLFGQPIIESAPLQPSSAKLPSFQGSRILLVEDIEFNRVVAMGMLKLLHIEVDYALNGEKAIEQLSSDTHYDLVLMDVQMPVMDGLTATRLLRADPRFAQLPIIAMTAHITPQDHEKSLAAGMNDHLNKPIDFCKLTATLQQWLKQTENNDQPLKEPAVIEQTAQELADTDNSLECLNLTKALQFAGNDEDEMRNRLGYFFSCHETLPDQLNALIQCGDYQGVRQIAHSLKSTSAYIGALRLQQSAAQLEASKIPLWQLATTVQEELQIVLTACFSYLPTKIANLTNNELPNNFVSILEELDIMIRKRDAGASVTLSELECKMADNPISTELAAIRNDFEELELDSALNRLALLRNTF
jgi:CheY-like chemotaxis protein/HPt (histidine-containing phosphotransfer) domain-containing protein